MNNRMLLMTITILAFCSARLEAQVFAYSNFTVTINDICYIRIYPTGTISMKLLASTAGNSLVTQTSVSTYMQLTSIAPENETRRITAIVSSGNVPAGTLFQLTTEACYTGTDARGTPASTITLDRSGQKNVVTGIGSCYTGTSSTSGYKLVYTWGVDPANMSQLKATSTVSITITYTVLSI